MVRRCIRSPRPARAAWSTDAPPRRRAPTQHGPSRRTRAQHRHRAREHVHGRSGGAGCDAGGSGQRCPRRRRVRRSRGRRGPRRPFSMATGSLVGADCVGVAPSTRSSRCASAGRGPYGAGARGPTLYGTGRAVGVAANLGVPPRASLHRPWRGLADQPRRRRRRRSGAAGDSTVGEGAGSARPPRLASAPAAAYRLGRARGRTARPAAAGARLARRLGIARSVVVGTSARSTPRRARVRFSDRAAAERSRARRLALRGDHRRRGNRRTFTRGEALRAPKSGDQPTRAPVNTAATSAQADRVQTSQELRDSTLRSRSTVQLRATSSTST